MNSIIDVHKITKSYYNGQKKLTVLDEVSFSLERGDTFSIVGPSGSGKTTLLGLCAGLDLPTAGFVSLEGHELFSLSEDQRAAVRNQHVGFIFQSFHLIPTLTAIENVMVPMELNRLKGARARAQELLYRVGLEDRGHHYPAQLSGGEQQRISLARAFSNNPSILFADEPTGNLDEETSEKVVKMIFDLNQENGTTLVLVTHDLDLARQTKRIIRLKGGKIVADQLNVA
ncbi:MAG: ABC transporter ATP-binding protein [Cyclobacteriaceae bacterium]|nr:MAG: ABC transporter ATP-binding protein [Cyclobacteriaceae bacterium]